MNDYSQHLDRWVYRENHFIVSCYRYLKYEVKLKLSIKFNISKVTLGRMTFFLHYNSLL